MLRIFQILLLCFALRCPACRGGRMFRSLFRMNVRCPRCGVIFERDAGEVTGGMAINTVATSMLAVSGAIVAFFLDVPVVPWILGLMVVTVGFCLLFYRHARALWTGILYITGSMFED